MHQWRAQLDQQLTTGIPNGQRPCSPDARLIFGSFTASFSFILFEQETQQPIDLFSCGMNHGRKTGSLIWPADQYTPEFRAAATMLTGVITLCHTNNTSACHFTFP